GAPRWLLGLEPLERGGTAYAVCLAGCVPEAIEPRPLLCEAVPLVGEGKVPCLSGLVFCSLAAADCSGCLLLRSR
ncbi:MAG: hypothetical protein AABX62_00360, partial [Thermoproteota archaeon]